MLKDQLGQIAYLAVSKQEMKVNCLWPVRTVDVFTAVIIP